MSNWMENTETPILFEIRMLIKNTLETELTDAQADVIARMILNKSRYGVSYDPVLEAFLTKLIK